MSIDENYSLDWSQSKVSPVEAQEFMQMSCC